MIDCCSTNRPITKQHCEEIPNADFAISAFKSRNKEVTVAKHVTAQISKRSRTSPPNLTPSTPPYVFQKKKRMLISSSKIPKFLSMLDWRLFESTSRLPLAFPENFSQIVSYSSSGSREEEDKSIYLRGLPTAEQIKAAFDAYAAIHPNALEEPPKRDFIKVTPFSLFQEMNIERIMELREKELADRKKQKSLGKSFDSAAIVLIVTRDLFDKQTAEELEKLKQRCARHKALSKILRQPSQPSRVAGRARNPNLEAEMAEFRSYSPKWRRVRGELWSIQELLGMFEEELEDILNTDVNRLAVGGPEPIADHRSRCKRFKQDIINLERFLGKPTVLLKYAVEGSSPRQRWRKRQRKSMTEIQRLEKELWEKYERDLNEWEEQMAADGHSRFIAILRQELASQKIKLYVAIRQMQLPKEKYRRKLDAPFLPES